MKLSDDLISQFAKLAVGSKAQTPQTQTFYATVTGDCKHVVIDGSSTPTPIYSYSGVDTDGNGDSIEISGSATTVGLRANDRVTVQIKDHHLIVTGNITNPSLDLQSDININGSTTETTKISQLGVVIADTIQTEILKAEEAFVERLDAVDANIDNLIAENIEISKTLTTTNGEITNLKATHTTITGTLEAANAEIDKLKATEADFRSLESDYADFVKTTTDELTAGTADIEKLKTDKLDVTWANIDYSNIDKAVLEEFYANTGLIENVVIQDGSITGHLVGVTIRGDLIETGTLVADKLVIKGEDGIFYKLNFEAGEFTDAEEVPTDGLHGSVIVAKSITAEKVNVSDLVAFDATVGGFHITDDSLYSGVKATIDNSTRGTYLGSDGQFAFGDTNNFIKFYKVTNANGEDVLDDEGNPIYKLDISADSILFGDGVKSSAADIKTLTEHVKIGTITDPETGDEKPCVELAEGDTSFKQVITNTKTLFMDGSNVGTEINTEGVHTDNITVDKEIRHNNQTGGFVWAFRSNGNYGLSWKKDVSS